MSGINSWKSAEEETSTLIWKLTTGATGVEICSRVIDSLENTHWFYESIWELGIQGLVTLLRKFSGKKGNLSPFQRKAIDAIQKLLLEKLRKVSNSLVIEYITENSTKYNLRTSLSSRCEPTTMWLWLSIYVSYYRQIGNLEKNMITSMEEIDIVHEKVREKFSHLWIQVSKYIDIYYTNNTINKSDNYDFVLC